MQKILERVWSSEVKPIIMTEEDVINFEKSDKCWICEKYFEEGESASGRKVCDHCDFSRKLQGAAHSKCNILCQKPKFVPVIFHNLSG